MRLVVDDDALRLHVRGVADLARARHEDGAALGCEAEAKRVGVIRAARFVEHGEAGGEEIRRGVHPELERSGRALFTELDREVTDEGRLVLHVDVAAAHRERTLDAVDDERHLDLALAATVLGRDLDPAVRRKELVLRERAGEHRDVAGAGDDGERAPSALGAERDRERDERREDRDTENIPRAVDLLGRQRGDRTGLNAAC